MTTKILKSHAEGYHASPRENRMDRVLHRADVGDNDEFIRATGVSEEPMDRDTIRSLVQHEIAAYDSPPTGITIGVPWHAERVSAYIEKPKAALVEPYLQQFELRESHEQTTAPQPTFAEFWIIAEGKTYCEWYDPATGDFGLGIRSEGSAIPISIGVRGDLVGVYCAM